MTPTIKEHTNQFLTALKAEDMELLQELPLQLAEEDRPSALKAILKAVKADKELAEKHEDILEGLTLIDMINDMAAKYEAAKAEETPEVVDTPTVEESTEEA